MNEKRFQKIVDTWIVAQDAESGTPEYDPGHWAIQLVLRWYKKPDRVWQLILAVLERDASEKVLLMIAAGPLEDLLTDWGSDYIERVEQLARTNEKFRYLLKGVWGQNTMPSEIWQRLQALRTDYLCNE